MRIAVLSDIHANLVALEAVLADLGTPDAYWHLGDIVGYGPEPDAVVERLAGLGAIGVLGNHDAVVAELEDGRDFNPDAKRAADWTMTVISAGTRAWLAALPPVRTEGDFTLVHGSPRQPTREYVDRSEVAAVCFPAFPTRQCLNGHTHVPAAYRAAPDGGLPSHAEPRDGTRLALAEGRFLLNPGSVGQPRDGDPRAAYAVLDTERGELSWHRVAYEIATTQARMRAVGLPPRLVERLAHGY